MVEITIGNSITQLSCKIQPYIGTVFEPKTTFKFNSKKAFPFNLVDFSLKLIDLKNNGVVTAIRIWVNFEPGLFELRLGVFEVELIS